MDVPEYGTLKVTMDDESIVTLENCCCVQVLTRVVAGVLTLTQYAFVGPNVTRTQVMAGGEGGEAIGGEGGEIIAGEG